MKQTMNKYNNDDDSNSKGKVVFKQVSTEEEYWKEHKAMKKRINKLFRKSFKFMYKPSDFINEYENILAEYTFKGVVSDEWADKQRKRLYKELNHPEEFKEFTEQVKQNILKRKDKAISFIKNKTKK